MTDQLPTSTAADSSPAAPSLSLRTVNLLRANLGDEWNADQVAMLPAIELRKWPGVGWFTIREIETWLKWHGRDFAPPPVQQFGSPPETAVVITPAGRLLTAAEFHRLADVPPEVEWFANLTNAHTRRAYKRAVKDFMRFTGIRRPEEFRTVARAHIIAWRDDLRTRLTKRGEPWSDASIRHCLSALAALFEYLCDQNAVTHNPVKGVARPKSESGEGKTPALGDHQARGLLIAPPDDAIKSKRDRAILSTLLFHGLRRDELCKLKVKDARHFRQDVPYLRVSGKGGKIRYVELHPGTNALIHGYLNAAGHAGDENGALFRPLRNNRTGELDKALDPDMIYKLVRAYSTKLGFRIGAHSLRATAATNALGHNADLKRVRDWLGHANIATTQLYDHRHTRPEDSPTYKVAY